MYKTYVHMINDEIKRKLFFSVTASSALISIYIFKSESLCKAEDNCLYQQSSKLFWKIMQNFSLYKLLLFEYEFIPLYN